MAIQKINLGTEPHGVGGDSYRTANDKINKNFEEVSTNITNVDEKYSNTEVKITEEVARAKQVEDELKTNLEKEASRAVSAEADILGVVESESKARTAENIRINEAQTQLKGLVESELSKLKLEDTSIKADLDKTHRYAVMSQTLGLGSKFYDKDGQPLSGGKVYTYEAGTSTPSDTYKDVEFQVLNTNPIILDETGSADVFLKGTYRFRIFDKSDTFVEEQELVKQSASLGNLDDFSKSLEIYKEGVTSNLETLKEKTLVVESIADLSTIKNPKDGLRVYVKSYHAGLGKGGGYFVYDSSKSSLNDGGIVINGWVRESTDKITPYLFGAYGDDNADDSASLQSAINYLKNDSDFDFMDGTYKINTPILLAGKKNIVLYTSGSALIRSGTTRIKSYFNATGSDGVTIKGLTFDQLKRNMPIYTRSDYADGVYNCPIYTQGTTGRITVKDCVFDDLYTEAISVKETSLLQVGNCRFYSGVQQQDQKLEHIACTTIGAVEVINNIFDNAPITNPANGVCGVVVSGVKDRVLITGNYFNYCGRDNTGNHRLGVIDFYYDAANITVTDNRADNTMGQFMRISDVKSGVVRGNNVTISPDCELGYSILTIESGAIASSFRACSNIKVLDNVFTDTAGRTAFGVGVLSYDWGRPSYNIDVSGNTFDGGRKPVYISGPYWNVKIRDNIISALGGGQRGGIFYAPNPNMTSRYANESESYYKGLTITGNSSQGAEMSGIVLNFSTATSAEFGTIAVTNNSFTNISPVETVGVLVDLGSATNKAGSVVSVNGNVLRYYNIAFKLDNIKYAELQSNHATNASTAFLTGTGVEYLSRANNTTLTGKTSGTATLESGTVFVYADCREGDLVQLTRSETVGTAGFLSTQGIVNGGFYIKSSSPTDNSKVQWQVIH